MGYLQNLGRREDAVEVLILHLTTIGIGYASPFLVERSDKRCSLMNEGRLSLVSRYGHRRRSSALTYGQSKGKGRGHRLPGDMLAIAGLRNPPQMVADDHWTGVDY